MQHFMVSLLFKSSLLVCFIATLYITPSVSAKDLEITSIPIASGVSYQLIGTYDLARLKEIITTELKEFSPYSITYPAPRYAVRLYRVTYPSVIPEQGNRSTTASGLLAVPDSGFATLPIVSYQHGTVFSRTEVPSRPDQSMETRLMIAQFASQGYAVIAADYFGKGVSPETDSYLVKLSTQQACLDMLHAAQAVSTDLKLSWGPLFLSGWSQGGWATMAFLNKLESVGTSVRAAATASAPVDLFANINHWIHSPSENDAIYLPALIAIQINSYEVYYGLPGFASSAIKPEYQSTARDLYLNKITWTEASPKLPAHLLDLLQPEFINDSSLGHSRYWEVVQQNQTYRWRSQTPLRIYYGDSDEVVPPLIATLPVAFQKVTGGAETAAIEVLEANHRATFLRAIADQKKWFDQLLSP